MVHHHTTVLPNVGRDCRDTSAVPRPNSRAFVVCRVNRDLGEVQTVFGDGSSVRDEMAPMQRGAVLTAQFERIKGLLLNGDVTLV